MPRSFLAVDLSFASTWRCPFNLSSFLSLADRHRIALPEHAVTLPFLSDEFDRLHREATSARACIVSYVCASLVRIAHVQFASYDSKQSLGSSFCVCGVRRLNAETLSGRLFTPDASHNAV